MTGTITADLRLSFDMVIRNPVDQEQEKVVRFVIDTGMPICMAILQEDVDDLRLPVTLIGTQVVASVEALVDDAELLTGALVRQSRSVGVQFLLGKVLRCGYPSQQIGFELSGRPIPPLDIPT
jgi:hypothetical protein